MGEAKPMSKQPDLSIGEKIYLGVHTTDLITHPPLPIGKLDVHIDTRRSLVRWYIISSFQLIVAVGHYDVGDWSAWIGPYHVKSNEMPIWESVHARGHRIHQKLAEFIFPTLARHFTWRN